ncbi:microtubule-associated protein futsch-like [Aricia agestis]|uniref:microtubule-associated protein futsch-like n=1 Tax=Aricia agestis TaxID=91739 RepID=UPI001C20C36C|nr:microtubule-associated protein futsch-like [Aricia agestis]
MPKGDKDSGGVQEGSSEGVRRSSGSGLVLSFGDDRGSGDDDRESEETREREGRIIGSKRSSCGIRAGVTVEELLGVESIPSMSESEMVATKRLFSEISGSDTEDVGTANSLSKVQTAKRGKTRGSLSRLSAARQELRERTEEARAADFVSALEKKTRKESKTGNPTPPGPLDIDVETMGPEDLLGAAESNLEEILSIAARSSNLKGGYAHKIRRATSAVRCIIDALASRTVVEETRRLTADNGRLRRELANLREEVRAYKRDFEESRASVAKERSSPMSNEQLGILEKSIAKLVGNLVDGRLAGLEARLPPPAVVRPPLAADKKREALEKRATADKSPVPEAAAARDLPPVLTTPAVCRRREEFPALPVRPEVRPAPTPAQTKKSKSKGKGKGKGADQPEPVNPGPSTSRSAAAERPPESSAASAKRPEESSAVSAAVPVVESSEPLGGWTEVVRRKTSAKKVAPKQPAQVAAKKPRVQMPRSTAVLVKLKADAADKGATYSSALLKAESAIKLDELGLGPLRIRQSATGARLIEIPGSTSHEKADLLAARLSEVLAEEADISRPVKCSNFKLTGLSDAATVESVISAVAGVGGCSPTQVWVGDIQRGSVGTGFARMSCPVMAAKKLVELGSFAVGWSRVTAHLVDARPSHCFRCLGLGHYAALCPPKMKDRSGLCYRCGTPGHTASGCKAKHPKCAVCSDSSRPSDHVMGGKSCNPPVTRGKVPSSGRGQAAPEADMSE